MLPDRDAADAQRKASIKSRVEKKTKDDQAKKERAAAKAAAKAAAAAAARRGRDLAAGSSTTTNPLPLENQAGSGSAPVDQNDEEEPIASCLHPDDIPHFLKLSRALQLLLRRDIAEFEVNEAEQLLRDYCTELISVCPYPSVPGVQTDTNFLQLYGPDVIKPNHHYATHAPDCVRDFGPLHEFWTFLFERLNKVLKSFKTNNRNGGELETTFFREFHRTIATSRLVAKSTMDESNPDATLFKEASDVMFSASADERGTVQALAKELDEARADGTLHLRCGLVYDLCTD